MNTNKSFIVKQGFVKLRSRKLGVLNKWWIVLKKPSSQEVACIEKYSNSKCNKMRWRIDLNNTQDVKLIRKRMKIKLIFENSYKVIRCMKGDDLKEWFNALNDVIQEVLSVKNADPALFNVFLAFSQSIKYIGECYLSVTSRDIVLFKTYKQEYVIARWSLNHLKCYGEGDGLFSFEAGRASHAVCGLFSLRSLSSKMINMKVEEKILSIYEMLQTQHLKQEETLENKDKKKKSKRQYRKKEQNTHASPMVGRNTHLLRSHVNNLTKKSSSCPNLDEQQEVKEISNDEDNHQSVPEYLDIIPASKDMRQSKLYNSVIDWLRIDDSDSDEDDEDNEWNYSHYQSNPCLQSDEATYSYYESSSCLNKDN